jgi:hypothetical protein
VFVDRSNQKAKMSPQEITDEIIGINQDISNIMQLVKNEKNPGARQRYLDSIERKKKRLIQLEGMRNGTNS